MGATETTATVANDAVEYFLEEQRYHGRSERTVAAYARVIRRFERYLQETASTGLAEASRRQCMEWIHSIRPELAPSTVATYASYLHRFYAYMVEIGEFNRNPMRLVMEELTESIENDPTRRDISIERMRNFVNSIEHPLHKCLIIVLLKTGMRVGELCNLDCRDLNLATPSSYNLPQPRGELDGRANSLFVSSTPIRGQEYNGEIRTASNKRQRQTIIPVDGEVEHVIHRWLAIRPNPRSPANPLFLNTADKWGERIDPETVRRIVRGYSSEAGWYQSGGSRTENVTPHYFRHFFTTHLRDRTGDRGIVKYLRGDVADDILDTYTHNWGDRVRTHYESNIYSLLG